MSNVDINVDRRTDGRTENRTPISHPATSRCDKNETSVIFVTSRVSQESMFNILAIYHTVNVLIFCTPTFLAKWHMQTVQTLIRLPQRSNLIRVYSVCILPSILRNNCIFIKEKKKSLNKKKSME